MSCVLCKILQDIIRLPRMFSFLQKPLAQFVSVLRAPKSREGYASIGGGSPLRRITDAQAEDLKKSLSAKNVPAQVYVGMRYWHPFTEEAIEQVLDDLILSSFCKYPDEFDEDYAIRDSIPCYCFTSTI